jgi:hypothetical protein
VESLWTWDVKGLKFALEKEESLLSQQDKQGIFYSIEKEEEIYLWVLC